MADGLAHAQIGRMTAFLKYVVVRANCPFTFGPDLQTDPPSLCSLCAAAQTSPSS